jgi:hypothetical protein
MRQLSLVSGMSPSSKKVLGGLGLAVLAAATVTLVVFVTCATKRNGNQKKGI